MADIQPSRQVDGNGSPTVLEVHPLSKPPSYTKQLVYLDTVNRLNIRSLLALFLIGSLSFSTVCCWTAIFLDAFKAWGFHMEPTFLKWLCGVTIAKSVVLLGVFVKAVWKTSEKPT
jgi:hypothetical protein